MAKNSKDSEKEPAKAPNLIPPGGILLTDAYGLVVNAINEDPERKLPFDEEWKKILKESKEIEDNEGKHNPDVYRKDGFDKHWFNCMRANLLIRLAIEACELDACIDDPETGKIRKLPTEDWTGEWYWERRIPARIWNNYISPDNYELPGPKGSFRGGALQPVFLLKDNFQNWFSKIFSKTEQLTLRVEQPEAPKEALEKKTFYPRGYARTKEAVKQVIFRIWPETKCPPADFKGMPLVDRVHKEFEEMEMPRAWACRRTIERAVSDLRKTSATKSDK